MGGPWYDPILREGEASKFIKMPFEATPAENFDFDPETGLILAYTGTDVDVVVPREIDGVTVVGFKDYNAFASCQDYTDTETETNQTDWVRLRTLVLPETIKALPELECFPTASSWKPSSATRRWRTPAKTSSCSAGA